MAKKTESTQPEVTEVGNVDQIRDIIFGSQMRDYEQRFSRLEERVLNESESLRSETSNRLDALETYIKQEVSSLVDQISNERSEREDDTRHMTTEMDKKLSQTQDKLAQGQGEARDALLEQSKSLLAEIQSVRTSLTDTLNKNTDKLHEEKTDRKALADMFSELAMRLNGDFKLPKGKE